MSIKGSVGDKKPNGKLSDNYAYDVMFVQNLLNFHIIFNPKMKAIATFPVAGAGDRQLLIAAIIFFQRDVLNLSPATGRIDPGDKTIKALMGEIAGMPKVETLAPPEDRLHNKLLQVRHDDYLDFNFEMEQIAQKQNIIEMIDILLLPDVDDVYLAEPVVYDYLNKTQSDIRLGGTIKEFHFKKSLIAKMDEKHSTRALLSLCAELYHKEILGGLQELNKVAGVETAAWRNKADGTRSEMSIAVENVQEWILQHNKNPKSIYHCLDLNVLDGSWSWW